jgi:hypothetical protein
MARAPLPGSYWLETNLLAGRYPFAEEQAVKTLLATGITFFLDLTQPGELPTYSSLLPQDTHHLRVSIPDFSVPSKEGMKRILDTLDTALADGHRIYLHCHGGLGRTGTVAGCLLVRRGMTGEEALTEIKRLRQTHGCDMTAASPESLAQLDMVKTWQPGT